MSIKIIDASAEETRHRGTGGRGVKTLGTTVLSDGTEAFAVSGSSGFASLICTEAEFTRPADTTSYAVSDAISDSTSAPTILSFANAITAGVTGYVVAVRAFTDKNDWTGAVRLHLYRETVTPFNDNAAFNLLFANRSKRIGYVDFSTWRSASATSDAAAAFADIPGTVGAIPFSLPAGATTIYALLEARATQAPASGQKFWFEISVQPA